MGHTVRRCPQPEDSEGPQTYGNDGRDASQCGGSRRSEHPEPHEYPRGGYEAHDGGYEDSSAAYGDPSAADDDRMWWFSDMSYWPCADASIWVGKRAALALNSRRAWPGSYCLSSGYSTSTCEKIMTDGTCIWETRNACSTRERIGSSHGQVLASVLSSRGKKFFSKLLILSCLQVTAWYSNDIQSFSNCSSL